jgi:hypothetical protein
MNAYCSRTFFAFLPNFAHRLQVSSQKKPRTQVSDFSFCILLLHSSLFTKFVREGFWKAVRNNMSKKCFSEFQGCCAGMLLEGPYKIIVIRKSAK